MAEDILSCLLGSREGKFIDIENLSERGSSNSANQNRDENSPSLRGHENHDTNEAENNYVLIFALSSIW